MEGEAKKDKNKPEEEEEEEDTGMGGTEGRDGSGRAKTGTGGQTHPARGESHACAAQPPKGKREGLDAKAEVDEALSIIMETEDEEGCVDDESVIKLLLRRPTVLRAVR